MKLKALVAALAVAAILPMAALADEPSPSDKANGARSCQALKTLGATFASTYGTNADKSNAFGKCVSKWVHIEQQPGGDGAYRAGRSELRRGPRWEDVRAVLRQRQEGRQRDEPVRPVEAAESAADKQKVVNAARACKAERTAMGAGPFKAKYGNTANAFGKCVSKLPRSSSVGGQDGRGVAASRPLHSERVMRVSQSSRRIAACSRRSAWDCSAHPLCFSPVSSPAGSTFRPCRRRPGRLRRRRADRGDLLRPCGRGGGRARPVAVRAQMLVGVAVFLVADRAVESRFGEAGVGGAMGIVVGSVVDGVPESVIFGIQAGTGLPISLSFMFAVFISNIPQSIARPQICPPRAGAHVAWGCSGSGSSSPAASLHARLPTQRRRTAAGAAARDADELADALRVRARRPCRCGDRRRVLRPLLGSS